LAGGDRGSLAISDKRCALAGRKQRRPVKPSYNVAYASSTIGTFSSRQAIVGRAPAALTAARDRAL